jgi:tetratricopeptide (TPR) repeat protein
MEDAVVLFPNSDTALFYYGWFLQRGENCEKAIAYMEKAIRFNPYPPPWWPKHLADCYLHQKRYRDAILLYEKSLKVSKRGEYSPLYVHCSLTFAYLELDMVDEALLHAAETLKIEPNMNFMWYATAHLGYKDPEYLNSLCKPLSALVSVNGLKKNVYVHMPVPVFKFEYPAGSQNIDPTNPDQVLAMTTPDGINFFADVKDITEGVLLAEVGPKYTVPNLEGLGSNIKVISNKEIILKDETTAYQTKIEWLWADGKTWINSNYVSAYRNGHVVILSIHPWKGYQSDVFWIVESLTFQ